MDFYMLFLLFIVGIFVGSFLGVIITRFSKNKSFVTGRSECDHCKHILGAKDLIPLLSFVSTLGRCRYCKAKLSYFYPAVELITGIVFSITYYFTVNNIYSLEINNYFLLILLLILFSSFIIIAFIDAREGIIPLSFLLVSYFFLLPVVYLTSTDFINNLVSGVGAGLFFLFLYLITLRRGIGFGDVLFAPIMGLLLGFPDVVVSLYVAFLTGAFVAIILIIRGKKRLKGSTIALGPFLVLGTIVAYFWSEYLIDKFLPFLWL